MLLDEYIAQVRGLVHDSAGNDWTDAELTAHINNARTTVALDTHCVRRLQSGLDAIAGRETYPISGAVGGVSVTNGGSGYTAPPTVTFSGGSPTVSAAATAIVSGGSVAAIYMTEWGRGYSSAPTVSLSGGGGSGAQAEAVFLINVLDVFSVTLEWGSWRATLDWQPFGAFQAFCRANPIMRGAPTIWSAYLEQALLYLFPVPEASGQYKMEWDTITLPSALTPADDNDQDIRPPYSDAVQYYAAFLALMKLQQFDQANALRNLYRHRINQILRTKQTPRMRSPYITYLSRFR